MYHINKRSEIRETEDRGERKKLKTLFIFRKRGRKGEREGEKHQWMVASRAPPTGGPGPQPRYVSRLGMEPATLWLTVQHSIH